MELKFARLRGGLPELCSAAEAGGMLGGRQ